MKTTSPRFGSLLLIGLLLLAASFGFYHLWVSRVDSALGQARQSLQSIVMDMDGTAHEAVAHIRILRTEAEEGLGRPPGPTPHPLLLGLVPRKNGFTTRQQPAGLDAQRGSYLFGGGPLPEWSGEVASEMEACLGLNPLMADIRRNVSGAAWVYYTSLNRFTNIYPFQGPGMADAVVWSKDFLTHPLFVETAPARNPGRAIRWHEAYVDQAGKGLLTSVVAPVFDTQDRFRAIVGLDFTLDTLSSYLKGPGIEIGIPLLLGPSGQVLAHQGRRDQAATKQLGELLPPALELSVQDLMGVASDKYVYQDGWYIHALDIQDAPWRLVFLVDATRLGWLVLGNMGVEVAGMVLLVLLLVGVERRRRLAEVLKDGDARYRRIIEGSDQGFWDWDLKTLKLTVSPRFELILEYRPGETDLEYKNWPPHIHPDDLPRMRASVDRHLEGRTPCHILEFRGKTKSGEWKWLLTQGKVVERDLEGRPLMMSGTLTDISERKRAEAELISAKQVAEAANVAKSRFLAAASHDLRQPLQASNLFVSALSRTPLNDDQKKIAHNLSLATKALGELLDALLDISKLDAGVVTPQWVPVEIYEIFQRIESEFASLAMEKDLRFKLYFPTRPLIFLTDPGLLMGLLRNLIGNAIRYTEWGGVLAGARLRKGCLVIQIWDTGIGITDEHLPRIYEEFFQVDNPQRDRGRGLGLGLSIVKRMADLLGYGLSCQSRYGRGTVFEISIPLKNFERIDGARLEKLQSRVENFAALEGTRCVLVEDDPLVATALESWLGSHGITMTHFPSGDQALGDPAIESADFYISDFRMPGDLNGIELLDAIQARVKHPICGLIVTGDTSMEQIDAFASAGWQVFHKPIDPTRLLEVMAKMRREIRSA